MISSSGFVLQNGIEIFVEDVIDDVHSISSNMLTSNVSDSNVIQ